MNHRSIHIGACAAVLASTLLGCATSTGEKVTVTRVQLDSIDSLGVVVEAQEPFQVRYSRDEAGSTGAMVGALTLGLTGLVVGSTIEAGAKKSADNKRTEALMDAAADFDAVIFLQNQVILQLKDAQIFDTVSPITAEESSDTQVPNSRLAFTLREWGLRRQQAGGTNDLLQVGLDMNAKLVNSAGKTLWERDDLVLDGAGQSLDDFKDIPGLLVERLSAALTAYAGRIANELRYMR